MIFSVYSVLFFTPIILVCLAIAYFTFKVMHRVKFAITAIFTTLGLHFIVIPLAVVVSLGVEHTTNDLYFNQFLLMSAMLQVIICLPFIWWLARLFKQETHALQN